MANRLKLFIKKTITICSAFVLAFGTMSASQICVKAAAPTYKVEFRAGAHGSIGGQTKSVVTAGYEETLLAVPEPDSLDSGYWFTGYSPEVKTIVTENVVYVAQYAKLINGVEYRVNYVDTMGVSLATQKVAYANEGETINAYAVAIDGYQADATSKTVVAQQSGTEITFIYSIPASGNTADGNNTAANVAVNVGVVNAGNAAGVAGNIAGGVNGVANVAGVAVDNIDGNIANAAEDGQLEAIAEDNVPQGQQNLAADTDGDLTAIDEEEVPLDKSSLSGKISTWTYVASISGFVIIGALVAFIISRKRMAKKNQK